MPFFRRTRFDLGFRGPDGPHRGSTGAVPAPDIGDAARFLRGDGTWADTPAGGGGVTLVTTTPYAVLPSDTIILWAVVGGVLTLPTVAAHLTDDLLIVDRTRTSSASPITVAAAGGQTVMGAASLTVKGNGAAVRLVGAGTDWSIG